MFSSTAAASTTAAAALLVRVATHSHTSCVMWLKLDLCVCAARGLAEGARFRGGPWQRLYTLISFG